MPWHSRVRSWLALAITVNLLGILGIVGCSDDKQRTVSQSSAQTVAGSGGSAAGADESDSGIVAEPDSDAGLGDADGGLGADDDAGTAALTDSQIGAVIGTVNDGEISLAEFALARSDVLEVRAYAHKMIDEHTAANEALAALLAGLGLDPTDSSVALGVRRSGRQIRATLASTPSPEFNLAYIGTQVEQHTAVLALIDDVLLPEVDNADLRAFLEATRVTVAAHLAEASAILSNPPAE